MPFNKNIKNKYGLLWLVFCICGYIFLTQYQTHMVSAPMQAFQDYQQTSRLGYYPSGFLEELDSKGHAIEKHVGQSVDYLHERLRDEDISAASTFNDMAEAEKGIRDVLMKRQSLIREWLKANRSQVKAFYHPSEFPIGRVLKRGWNKPSEGNQVRVVLFRDDYYETGFYILTAYPEIR